MGQSDFQERHNRIGAQPSPILEEAPVASPKLSKGSTFSVKSAVIGAVCSIVVMFLFFNLQAISDLAPESVKQSDTPGAFGVPVAILSVGWFTVIPIWFGGAFIFNALRRRPKLGPPAFVSGAFVVIAIGFLLMSVLGGQGAG